MTIKPGASQHFWMRHQLLEMGDNGRLGYCRRTLGLHPLYLVPVGTGKGDKCHKMIENDKNKNNVTA